MLLMKENDKYKIKRLGKKELNGDMHIGAGL